MAREEINVDQLLKKRKAYNQEAFQKLKTAKKDSRRTGSKKRGETKRENG